MRGRLPVGIGTEGVKSQRMGCDIHAWLEVKPKDSEVWKIVEECPCGYCGGTGEDEPATLKADGTPLKKPRAQKCFACRGTKTTKVHVEIDDGREYLSGGNCYAGRNYVLFAALAGVRNYFDIEPKFEPRGIPEDASVEYAEYCKQGDGDLHGHGWLTMDELIAAFMAVDRAWEDGHMPFAEFVKHVIEKQMKPLVAKHGELNVRMVFCFDN